MLLEIKGGEERRGGSTYNSSRALAALCFSDLKTEQVSPTPAVNGVLSGDLAK